MEVKVRIDCPACDNGRVYDAENVRTCEKCAGTGKREEWRPIVAGLKIVDSEEAR